MVKLSAFSIATLVFFALGCAEKTASQNAPAASAAPSSSTAAPATTPSAVPPTLVPDRMLLAEVKKMAACEWSDRTGISSGCDQALNFDKVRNAYTKTDDKRDPARTKKLLETCLSLLGDSDQKLRFAAADCLHRSVSNDNVNPDATLATATAKAMLERLAEESSAPVALALAEGLSSFHAGELGLEDKIVPILAKKSGDNAAQSMVAELLYALRPKNHAAPSPAVVEAAIVSLKSAHREARANAGLLLRDAAKLGEECERVGKIVADSGSGWSFAAALWSKSDTCKAEFDKLVDRIVAEAKLQEKIFSEDSVNGINGYDMDNLLLFVKNPALTPEQKKKMATAVKPLKKEEHGPGYQRFAEKMLEDLK